MLKLYVPDREFYDEKANRFFTTKATVLQLEHSLLSLSKWESDWCKPFLDKKEKTPEEMLDYVRCMTINKEVNPNVYYALNTDEIKAIFQYVERPMTATWFSDDKRGRMSREIITSEIIYYWMIALKIPFECQKWHLNRLLTLIKVCSIKEQPPKKMGKKAIYQQNRAINAAHRRAHNSKG